MTARPPSLGFVGLGVMGRPMASHLAAAGHAMTLYDIAPGVADALAATLAGAQAARTPAELAARSDVVVTMVPNGGVVRSLVEGADGLLAGLGRGALLLDTSSSEPWLTEATGRVLAEAGVAMVDAPVSGAEWGAQAAELVFMCGGAAADVERVRPLLDVMGKAVFHLGPLGAGHAMKCLNNLVTAINLLAVSEGLAIGTRYGLDPAAMVEVLDRSTGMSWVSQTHIRQRVLSRSFDDPFKLALMLKDIGIATQLARSVEVPAPLGAEPRALARGRDRRHARRQRQRARPLGRAPREDRDRARRAAHLAMRVLVTGADGFIGRALVEVLRADADVMATDRGDGDIADPAHLDRLFGRGPIDRVFHLAAVVSGAAEADFDAGRRVNLDATLALLDRCRAQARRGGPVVRFTLASSIAVFGTPLPARIDDATAPAPSLSYGTHKRVAELLIDDATRRGELDGRALRLAGVVVRPRLPNGALSAFNSDLIREPLAGREYECPVGPEATIWVTSRRVAVANLLRLADCDGAAIGAQRAVTAPALAISIEAIVAALGRVDSAAPGRVRHRPQPAIEAQFGRWPRDGAFARAESLGLAADASIDDIVREHARSADTQG